MVKYTEAQVRTALETIRNRTIESGSRYLTDIRYSTPAIMVTCPFHGNHSESTPSCGVFIQQHGSFPIGNFHCFACGHSGTLAELTACCLSIPTKDAEDWLLETCGGTRIANKIPPIEIKRPEIKKKKTDESCLDKYDFYHPYMWERKLTKEVVDKFRIGYDKETNSIVFPVWDEHGDFKFVTKRSVVTKKFDIPASAEKPVYLLNYAVRESEPVYVCESQINTLTCYCYGKTAVGLFGTGSKEQIKILNRSGINHFILALDPDDAGEAGTARLISNLRTDKLVDVMIIPKGKDINDLTKEEFDECKVVYSREWLKTQKTKETSTEPSKQAGKVG